LIKFWWSKCNLFSGIKRDSKLYRLLTNAADIATNWLSCIK
jgi:hypothetical protein